MKGSTTETSADKIDFRRNDYTSHSTTYEQQRFAGRNNEYLESLRQRAVLAGLRHCRPDAKVLDVGCGTGRGLCYLAEAGFKCVTGLDYTAAMLQVALDHQRENRLPRSFRLVRGDAFSLPGGDNSFDAVISLNFLHMFRFDPQAEILMEMTRVCRPGGVLVAEFESIHKGLFVTRYLEQRRLAHRTKFNSLPEIGRLFPRSRFARVRVRGTALPAAYWILSRVPRLGRAIETVTHLPPFNWLAERIVVSAEKR